MKNLALLVTLSLAVMLSGCVGLFIAGAATTVNLITDPRTTEEIWNDNYIEAEVTGLIKKPPYRGKSRIVSSSFRGSVVLMGQAAEPETLHALEQDVAKIKGVTQVHNQVRTKEALTTAELTKDTWITTKVKSALVTDNELNGVKIKVITEDREVFLFGYVSHAHAEKASQLARNVAGVKQVILAFQYGD